MDKRVRLFNISPRWKHLLLAFVALIAAAGIAVGAFAATGGMNHDMSSGMGHDASTGTGQHPSTGMGHDTSTAK